MRVLLDEIFRPAEDLQDEQFRFRLGVTGWDGVEDMADHMLH